MKTILMSAYAVNPYKGSEDGMGWNFICQAARFSKVIAVTRENNEPAIKKYMDENPEACHSNISFIYFDLPYWMRFWKRGGSGALLYYYMWQLALPRFIRNTRCKFDIVHNLNFHNDWTPSFLWKLNKPFVWGPIGHHPPIPFEFVLAPYGTRAFFTDRLRWIVKRIIRFADPSLKSTVKNSSAIIAMNKDVAKELPRNDKNIFIMPSVGSEATGIKQAADHSTFHILAIGRFIPLKGFDVAIRSFAHFYRGLDEAEKKM